MLITIKLACGFDNAHAGESFQVNCDPDETVTILKYIIQESLAMNVSIEDQKLVYAGVILENSKKLSTYNIDEKKFIVLLINKLTTSPMLKLNTINNTDDKDNKVEENKSSAPIEHSPSTSKPTTTNDCNKENTNTNSNITTVKINENLKSMPLTKTIDNDYETKKKQMMEMGYCKELVEQSLLVSFDNPERAVQYLLDGIPYNIFQSFDIEHLTTINQQLRNNATDQSSSEQSINIFRDIPQLQSLCKFLQKHPEQLNEILLLIAQKHPSLFDLISTHQSLFVIMLNEPIPNAEDNVQGSSSSTQNNTDNASVNNALDEILNEYNKTNDTNIEFTIDDRESLQRLQQLGCSVDEAFKVYIACDQNEIYAANILLNDKKK